MDHDVIVIGAGLAGMVASLSAAAEGASVLLTDRGAMGIGTNSAISNAAFTSPTKNFSIDAYVEEAVRVGKGLNRSAVVRLIAKEAPTAIEYLESFGVQFQRSDIGYVVISPRKDVIRGVAMVQRLAGAVKENDRIETRGGFYVTELLVREGHVCGVKGIDGKGRGITFSASAVIIAAGGAGGIYLRNDNQKSTLGQGYALCAKAGIDLWDMEFVQFYPLVIAEPGLPGVMLYPPYPEEVKLIDARGEDVAGMLGRDKLGDAILKQRDALSELIYRIGLEGAVYMDYRDVPENRWQDYPMTLFDRIHFDFKKTPIRVTPGAHYCMGGVRIDDDCRTDLKGLFACGEMVWGLHGANRRGGNALTECAVFGRTAGRCAARQAKENPNRISPRGEHRQAEPAWAGGDAGPAMKALRGLKRRLLALAWNNAGILRNEEGISLGQQQLKGIDAELEATAPINHAEWKLKQDVESGALVLKAVLAASAERKESRGAFVREDFPDLDDQNWKKNTCLSYDAERRNFTVQHYPVA